MLIAHPLSLSPQHRLVIPSCGLMYDPNHEIEVVKGIYVAIKATRLDKQWAQDVFGDKVDEAVCWGQVIDVSDRLYYSSAEGAYHRELHVTFYEEDGSKSTRILKESDVVDRSSSAPTEFRTPSYFQASTSASSILQPSLFGLAFIMMFRSRIIYQAMASFKINERKSWLQVSQRSPTATRSQIILLLLLHRLPSRRRASRSEIRFLLRGHRVFSFKKFCQAM
jgi:hypothetical protein